MKKCSCWINRMGNWKKVDGFDHRVVKRNRNDWNRHFGNRIVYCIAGSNRAYIS